MRKIVLIAHNIRSAHNVGSILRSSDGFGVTHVYLSGYTPYPTSANDVRLPHIAKRVSARINKTSLSAENSVVWNYSDDIFELIKTLSKDYFLIGLEQTPSSTALPKFQSDRNIALFVGNEIEGIPEDLLSKLDQCLEIPMLGQKESFNVAIAAAIALYHLRFET